MIFLLWRQFTRNVVLFSGTNKKSIYFSGDFVIVILRANFPQKYSLCDLIRSERLKLGDTRYISEYSVIFQIQEPVFL